jgi:uncharacterized protein (TIGR02001 family)
MKQVKVWSALGLVVVSGLANAGVSSTITLTNDYDFRGVSQSAKDPALQASLDYAHDSGWYAGGWASNVDFGDDTNFELDLYTGFTGKTDAGLGWDAGLIYYTYDEHRYNFPEIYTALSYSYFKGKLSYTHDYGGDSTPGHVGALNLALDAALPLPVENLTATAHVGRSEGNRGFVDYTDYSVGVGYTVKKFNLALKYVDTNLPNPHSDVFNSEGRLIVTVATTLPW